MYVFTHSISPADDSLSTHASNPFVPDTVPRLPKTAGPTYHPATYTPSEASSEEEEEVEDQRRLRTYRKLMERVGITKKHARYVPLFEKARKLGVGEASGRRPF